MGKIVLTHFRSPGPHHLGPVRNQELLVCFQCKQHITKTGSEDFTMCFCFLFALRTAVCEKDDMEKMYSSWPDIAVRTETRLIPRSVAEETTGLLLRFHIKHRRWATFLRVGSKTWQVNGDDTGIWTHPSLAFVKSQEDQRHLSAQRFTLCDSNFSSS